MKLSICIPTKERAEYLQHSIQTALAIEDDEIEIIVSNNASQDDTAEVLSRITDPRLKVLNTGSRVSMRQNFENCMEAVTGEYVIFFGDDDGIISSQVPALKLILEKHRPDALSWPTGQYGWPIPGYGKNPGGLRLTKSKVLGTAQKMDAEAYRRNLLSCDLTTLEGRPRIYHGAVSTKHMEEIRKISGHYFAGSIPDIYFTYASIMMKSNVYHIRHPFTINAYSPKSNGGSQKDNSKNIESTPAKEFDQENRKDAIKDIVDFGISVPSVLFSTMETVIETMSWSREEIDYANWYQFVIEGTQNFTGDKLIYRDEQLDAHSQNLGSPEALDFARKNLDIKSTVWKKIRRKLTENWAKRYSVRVSGLAPNGENTIHTIEQKISRILGANLEQSLQNPSSSKNKWRAILNSARAEKSK